MTSGGSVQHPGANRSRKFPNIPQDRFRIVPLVIRVQDDVADFAVGLIVLSGDIDPISCEDVVQFSEFARQVPLDLDKAGAVRSRRELNLREIDSTFGRWVCVSFLAIERV